MYRRVNVHLFQVDLREQSEVGFAEEKPVLTIPMMMTSKFTSEATKPARYSQSGCSPSEGLQLTRQKVWVLDQKCVTAEPLRVTLDWMREVAAEERADSRAESPSNGHEGVSPGLISFVCDFGHHTLWNR